MKVLFALLLIGGIFVSFAIFRPTTQTLNIQSPQAKQVKSTGEAQQQQVTSRSFIFVPYWTFQNSLENTQKFDQVIYFGVTADIKGIDTTDPGFAKVATFPRLVPPSAEKILAIRMLNSVTNADVIKDLEVQNNIIQQAGDLAVENNYDGVLLDFEMNAIPFQKVIDRITAFYERSATAYHKRSLKFYVTSYGDNYFRIRPYDLKKIGALSDGIYIMAYDFHKANGDPGPNFPLSGKNTYGYDFSSMIRDFTSEVDKEKLFVTFGLYGYDWTVDEKGKSVKKASSLSLAKIEQNFITQCIYTNCTMRKDLESGEQRVHYTDNNGISHIIWYENNASIEKKKAFLEKKGIVSYGYWAYSYGLIQ